ncbi:hypothetical protein ARMGADRAFT_1087763 [Armillaria gallica]|uniref:Uncharacterized protein n=1 Tax=Armillaria gallica TaxID=47427 RepID=A0A2H3DA01_ARMGA|nr:hypothetical protein ARMGADRAFT_1087763 [Armillaria gallica]
MPRNPHRLDAYANKSSSFKPRLTSWRGDSSTLHPNEEARSILQAERGTAVLSTSWYSSPKVAVFYATETFTTGFIVLPTTPLRSNFPKYEAQLPKQTAMSA